MPVVVDTTARSVLDVAIGELGNHEQPFGSNKTKYGAWYGMNGVAWCNIWVTWVLHHAGAEEIPKFAYTPSSAQYFKDRGAWLSKHESPQPGDLVWFDFPNDGVNRISHIGIVEGVLPDGRIATIEGNTNERGGRTGGRVMRHNRSVSGGIVGFGRITYLGNKPELKKEEDDMRILYINDGPAKGQYHLQGPKRVEYIPEPGLLESLRKAGIPEASVNQQAFEAVLRVTLEGGLPLLVTVAKERQHELPERMRDAHSANAWLYIDAKEFWWCPTVGHADENFRLGLAQNARPVVVSPSFIKERLPRCSADLDPSSLIEGPKGVRASFFSVNGAVHPSVWEYVGQEKK